VPPKLNFRRLTTPQVAEALSVTVDTVKHWQKKGCPGPPFDLAVVLPWRVQYEVDQQSPVVTGAESEEALERKRHWDAENAKLKNRQLRGELLERTEVLKTITDTAHQVRIALQNIGSELSVTLSRTHDAIEVREQIDEAVARCLGGLQLPNEEE